MDKSVYFKNLISRGWKELDSFSLSLYSNKQKNSQRNLEQFILDFSDNSAYYVSIDFVIKNKEWQPAETFAEVLDFDTTLKKALGGKISFKSLAKEEKTL